MKLRRYLIGLIGCVVLAAFVVSQLPSPRVEGAAGQADAEAARSVCEDARTEATTESDAANSELAVALTSKQAALNAQPGCTDPVLRALGDSYLESANTKIAEADAAMFAGNGWFTVADRFHQFGEQSFAGQEWDKAIHEFVVLAVPRYDQSAGKYLEARYAVSYANYYYGQAEQAYIAGAIDTGTGM